MHLFCNPSSNNKRFSFNTYDEFNSKNVTSKYSIDFISGKQIDHELFEAADLSIPEVLKSFMEFCESRTDIEKEAMYYLLGDLDMTWEDALYEIHWSIANDHAQHPIRMP